MQAQITPTQHSMGVQIKVPASSSTEGVKDPLVQTLERGR
jgi:hypothetical protein